MPRFACLAAAFAATLLAAPAAAETTNCMNIVSLPAVLSAQGVYCLKQDLATNMTSGAAITINNNNITIDFNGFKLGGLGGGQGTQASGVYALGRNNITLRNGNIRGFKTGIYLNGSNGGPESGHLVENNLVDSSTSTGIFAAGSGVTIRGNRVVNTGPSPGVSAAYGLYGIFLVDSVIEGNVISDTEANGNARGIDIYVSSDLTISRNTISKTSSPGGDAYAIHLNKANRVNVLDNSLVGTVAGGYATGVRSIQSSLLIIHNNDINGLDGDVNHGLALVDSTFVICRDNTITEARFIPLGCTTQIGTVSDR
jgi:parallel beta-helix repeat protein